MTRIPQTSSVTAGLLGASALAVPARAYGFALADASKVGVLTADFLLGLVAGAASCGAVALAVSVASSRSKKRAGAAVPMDRTTVTNKTGDFQIPRAQPAMGPAQADAAAVPEAAAAPASGAAPVVHDARNGCPSNPRHLRDRVPEVDRKVPVRKAPAAPAPVVKPASATQKPNRPAQHEATDYTDIATNYVHRKTVADRAKSRARGVKQLLAERMSRDMFDDLPVIQRADGTVGDVGTGWWNAKLGDSVRTSYADVERAMRDVDMTGASGVLVPKEIDQRAAANRAHAQATPQAARPQTTSQVKPVAPVAVAGLDPDETTNVQQASAQRLALAQREANERFVKAIEAERLAVPKDRAGRLAYLTQRIAEVDEGVFPERRDPEELDSDDLWDLAMAKMDAHLAEQEALAAKEASDETRVIEPENPTQVLPFRPVAGHPEVVDKTSYVDYLIRTEFDQNSSQAVRRTSRDYLRVLEGGSSQAPTVIEMRNKPRHMACNAEKAAARPRIETERRSEAGVQPAEAEQKSQPSEVLEA